VTRGRAGELFYVTVELAGQPGFQDNDVGPTKARAITGTGTRGWLPKAVSRAQLSR
jgi:hypothetical protein